MSELTGSVENDGSYTASRTKAFAMNFSGYSLVLLGVPSGNDREVLESTLTQMISELGITLGDDIQIINGVAALQLDTHGAMAAVYFTGDRHADADIAENLIRKFVPVIPFVRGTAGLSDRVPECLRLSNAVFASAEDPELNALSANLLECVGLLREQRRVFVSYRRIESRVAAVQLHDAMTARGFDVFLDTHDVRGGSVFQDVLWQRLCDSDVLIVLDTETYFQSKWTVAELGRAEAQSIHILRLVWPEITPNRHLSLSETYFLARADVDADGELLEEKVQQLIAAVEKLRSRSIAARFRIIADKLSIEITRIGGKFLGSGMHRSMHLQLVTGSRIWAYPLVGIPTAQALNDVALKAENAKQMQSPILVYDSTGIGVAWQRHLQWLDDNVKSVRAVKVHEAALVLASFGTNA